MGHNNNNETEVGITYIIGLGRPNISMWLSYWSFVEVGKTYITLISSKKNLPMPI